MNRISSRIRICEDQLDRARALLIDIDEQVAGKSFLAHLLYYACLLTGIGENVLRNEFLLNILSDSHLIMNNPFTNNN